MTDKLIHVLSTLISELIKVKSDPVKDFQPYIKWVVYGVLAGLLIYDGYIDDDNSAVDKTITVVEGVIDGELK